jgi:hypothetical protein
VEAILSLSLILLSIVKINTLSFPFSSQVLRGKHYSSSRSAQRKLRKLLFKIAAKIESHTWQLMQLCANPLFEAALHVTLFMAQYSSILICREKKQENTNSVLKPLSGFHNKLN